MPRVINLRNTRGILPPGAVYVGRAMPRYGLAASKFGNPFRITKEWPREAAITHYEMELVMRPDKIAAAKDELQGKDLACWCAPLPCHADVLLRIANAEVPHAGA